MTYILESYKSPLIETVQVLTQSSRVVGSIHGLAKAVEPWTELLLTRLREGFGQG